MPPGIGYSRDIPLAGEGGANGQQTKKLGGLSPQEAVKILSLRIPDQPSATSIAPLPLLQSPGGTSLGGPGLDRMMQGLMAAFPPTLPTIPGGGRLGRGDVPKLPTFQPPIPEANPMVPPFSGALPPMPSPDPLPEIRSRAMPPRSYPLDATQGETQGGGESRDSGTSASRVSAPPQQLAFNSPEVLDFLRRNPGDEGRLEAALGRPVAPRITVGDLPPIPTPRVRPGEDEDGLEIMPLF